MVLGKAKVNKDELSVKGGKDGEEVALSSLKNGTHGGRYLMKGVFCFPRGQAVSLTL